RLACRTSLGQAHITRTARTARGRSPVLPCNAYYRRYVPVDAPARLGAVHAETNGVTRRRKIGPNGWRERHDPRCPGRAIDRCERCCVATTRDEPGVNHAT